MGNYEQLKAAISSVIKDNGNQEITGRVLQSVLLSIVSGVGKFSTFAGLALPETAPGELDQDVFYLASKAGVYPNFGGIELIQNEVAVLDNSEGSWRKVLIGLVSNEGLLNIKKEEDPIVYDIAHDGAIEGLGLDPSTGIFNATSSGFAITQRTLVKGYRYLYIDTDYTGVIPRGTFYDVNFARIATVRFKHETFLEAPADAVYYLQNVYVKGEIDLRKNRFKIHATGANIYSPKIHENKKDLAILSSILELKKGLKTKLVDITKDKVYKGYLDGSGNEVLVDGSTITGDYDEGCTKKINLPEDASVIYIEGKRNFNAEFPRPYLYDGQGKYLGRQTLIDNKYFIKPDNARAMAISVNLPEVPLCFFPVGLQVFSQSFKANVQKNYIEKDIYSIKTDGYVDNFNVSPDNGEVKPGTGIACTKLIALPANSEIFSKTSYPGIIPRTACYDEQQAFIGPVVIPQNGLIPFPENARYMRMNVFVEDITDLRNSDFRIFHKVPRDSFEEEKSSIKKYPLLGSAKLFISKDVSTFPTSQTQASEIYAMYDNLLAKYPEFVSKRELGRGSDNSMLYEYTFCNALPEIWDGYNDIQIEYKEEPRPIIPIISGVHGDEKGSVWGLALLMKQLCEAKENEALYYVRTNSVVRVIPIVNVYGFNNNQRNNSNDFNINRDYVKQSQKETQIVVNWFDSMKDNAITFLDYHNTIGNTVIWNNTNSRWTQAMLAAFHFGIEDDIIKRNSSFKNYRGSMLKYYIFDTLETSEGYFFNKRGVKTASVVESCRHSESLKGLNRTDFDALGTLCGMEELGNMIILALQMSN